jgi:hypothetical protein
MAFSFFRIILSGLRELPDGRRISASLMTVEPASNHSLTSGAEITSTILFSSSLL